MNAMILSAGLGTRLRPVTNSIAKPVVPFFGKPVLEYSLDVLAAVGVRKAVLNLHHLPETVMKCIGESYSGMEIVYSHEPEILGPVGGVANALKYLDDEPFIVVNGDILVDFDPVELVETHKSSGAAFTMSVGSVPGRTDLNLVGVNTRERRVVRVKNLVASGGDDEDSSMVNLGVFVYEPEILRRYADPGAYFGFTDGLLPLLFSDGHRVSAHVSDGYWNDIGTLKSFLDAHFEALDGNSISGVLDVCGRSRFLSGLEVTQPVFIGSDVSVGVGAKIGPYAVAGDGAEVGDGAVVERSVLLPGASVKPGIEIRDAIVHGEDIITV